VNNRRSIILHILQVLIFRGGPWLLELDDFNKTCLHEKMVGNNNFLISIHLAKLFTVYFTNLDIPEIKGDFPKPRRSFWGPKTRVFGSR